MSRRRFLKASALYESQIRAVYAKFPNLKDMSYQEQYSTIMGEFFVWSDSWKHTLEETGDFDAVEVVTNAEPLQKAWAIENKVPFGPRWAWEILEAQIAQFRPEILFAQDYSLIQGEERHRLRARYGIQKILAWDGIAYNDPKKYDGVDLILSCVKATADFYRGRQIQAHHFVPGFDQRILGKLGERKGTPGASFVGSLDLQSQHHLRRLKILGQLSRASLLTLHIAHLGEHEMLSPAQKRRLRAGKFQEWWDVWSVGKRNQGPRFGLEMLETLRNSDISLNIHIDRIGDQAANFRLFETTGVGSCLLTDRKSNLHEIFELDREVVVFDSAADCAEKIRYLTRNEKHRTEIASAGQKRTLRDHTLQNAVKRVLPLLS